MSVLNNISGAVLKPVLKEISRTRLPKIDGKLSISGLKEDVEIIRDELGIAHIYANNINDLMFALLALVAIFQYPKGLSDLPLLDIK